ncbi:MAG: hypothetical protein HFF50_02425 [Lawsonibacter sp.]|nr:hypothetical protein [Lawsonibacter sp.]
MSKLSTMMNVGRELENKLTTVGIASAEELLAVGAKQAFSGLKERYPQVCLVHLYALEGAVEHVEFHCLSKDKKRELKAFCDSLKQDLA